MNSTIETIAIGDEILTGTIADTNSAYIGDEMMKLGYRLARETVIADDEAQIIQTLEERSERARLIFVFGGLGPTSDDRTVAAVCRWLGTKPKEHEASRSFIEIAYRQRGQPLNPHALKQALYPETAEPLANLVGMAPGFRVIREHCELYFLPGVPLEMEAIFQHSIRPRVHGKANEMTHVHTKIWKCLGIFESQLQVTLDPVEAMLGTNAWLGYRTHFPENHLTLYYRDGEPDHQKVIERINELLKPWCFTRERESIESIVLRSLKQRGWRLSLAESCTGGLVSNRISRIAGASDALWGGVCVYQLDAKQKLLGLQLENSDQAVTQQATRSLALHILDISGSEMSAAVTGFLGPDPGSAEAPAGTVFCCAVDKKQRMLEKRFQLNTKNRERTQWGAATYLLDVIRQLVVTV